MASRRWTLGLWFSLALLAGLVGSASSKELVFNATCDVVAEEFQSDSSEIHGANTTNVTTVWPNGFEVTYFDSNEQLYCSQSFVNIPGINLFSSGARAFLYALGLAYIFLGVALIADIFMSSVEEICAQEKTVTLKDGTVITAQVWNATVANLTLMALGSSAPEIMLAIIETILTLGLPPGELGPSTIVGSAAFNLLMISAVCIVSLPGNEVKAISDITVFVVTAIWSVLVYVWMFVALDIWTPGVVSMAEAWITLFGFVVFVLHAYLQDRRWFVKRPSEGEGEGEDEGDEAGASDRHTDQEVTNIRITNPDGTVYTMSDPEDIKALMLRMKRSMKGGATKLKSAFSLVLESAGGPIRKRRESGRSLLFWKINQRHKMAGKKYLATREEVEHQHHRPRPSGSNEPSTKSYKSAPPAAGFDMELNRLSLDGGGIDRATRSTRSTRLHLRSPDGSGNSGALTPKPEIHECKASFTTHDFRVVENQGSVRIAVRRTGDEMALSVASAVDYETSDGTAKSPYAYTSAKGTLVFEPGEVIKYLTIAIHDNEEPNPDQTFNIILHNHREHGQEDNVPTLASMGRVIFRLGSHSLTQASSSFTPLPPLPPMLPLLCSPALFCPGPG